MSRMGRFAMVVAVLGVVLGACGSPVPDPAAQLQLTPWETEMANIEPDGTRSLASTLRLFGMAFGPLPGVDAPPAESGLTISASPAVRAVHAHWDELTSDQQVAVERHLAVPDSVTPQMVPPATGGQSLAGKIAAVGPMVALEPARVTHILAEIGRLRAKLADEWGDFPNDVATYVYEDERTGPTWYEADIGRPDPNQFQCRIFVTKPGWDDEALSVALAHEVFYCGAAYKIGSQFEVDSMPAWVIEGAAHYFALSVNSTSFKNAWNKYFLQADLPLFQRDYDAIGFWSHIQYRFGGVYAAVASALRDGTNEERFVRAGASADDFLDTWASGLFRDRLGDLGRDWNTDGPSLSPVLSTPAGTLSILTDDVEIVDQDAYSNHLYTIETSADLLTFDFVGRPRLADHSGVDTTLLAPATFCTKAGGCPPCPDESDPGYPTLDRNSLLAVSGGMDGTHGTISGSKMPPCPSSTPPTAPPSVPATPPSCPNGLQPAAALGGQLALTGATNIAADDCQPPTDPCLAGCPMSNGDVHLVTIDGDSYDFQAVGEFVLLRTPDGSFEVQGRQEAFAGSSAVSINTAISLRVNGLRIGVYGNEDTDNSLTILVDGNPVDPRSGPVSVGSTTITYVDDLFPAYEVELPDGTRVSVAGQVDYGINLTIVPSESVRHGAVGLMGPIEPNSMGVPALPDGTVFPLQLDGDAYNAKLYGEFEEAWRVTTESSLFDYTEGRTTASYINPSFPVVGEIVTLADITPAQRAAGESACAAINIEFLRAQCVYDVAVTGVNVAALYDISAQVVDRGTIMPTGQLVRVVNLYWDAITGAQPLDVYAWSAEGAALVTTVGYGEVTDFFNPGVKNVQFGEVLVSLQRAGQPPMEEAFNFAELRMYVTPGLQRTYIVGTNKPDPLYGGGSTPSIVQHDEESPSGYPMLAPLPDRGLLFLDITALVDTHDPVEFYMSAGDGCLTQPDFPTLAQASGVGDNSWGYEGPLAVTPGTNLELTLHQAKQEDDPFQVRCDTPPIAGPVPFSLEAGQRSHLILYSIPGDPAIRSLILPFGE